MGRVSISSCGVKGNRRENGQTMEMTKGDTDDLRFFSRNLDSNRKDRNRRAQRDFMTRTTSKEESNRIHFLEEKKKDNVGLTDTVNVVFKLRHVEQSCFHVHCQSKVLTHKFLLYLDYFLHSRYKLTKPNK